MARYSIHFTLPYVTINFLVSGIKYSLTRRWKWCNTWVRRCKF